MKPRREGMISQLLGLLVVIAAALEIRYAAQQFAWTFYHGRSVGIMNLVWLFAIGVFAGFLLLTGATVIICGHVMRAVSGVTHRGRMWSWPACSAVLQAWLRTWQIWGMLCCPVPCPMDQALLFDDMLFHGGFAIAIAGRICFRSGDQAADGRSAGQEPTLGPNRKRLLIQPVAQETSPVVAGSQPRTMTNA